jgi:hypothetical protein
MSTPSPNDFTTLGTGTPAGHTLVSGDFRGSPMISVIIPSLDRPTYLWDTVTQVLPEVSRVRGLRAGPIQLPGSESGSRTFSEHQSGSTVEVCAAAG